MWRVNNPLKGNWRWVKWHPFQSPSGRKTRWSIPHGKSVKEIKLLKMFINFIQEHSRAIESCITYVRIELLESRAMRCFKEPIEFKLKLSKYLKFLIRVFKSHSDIFKSCSRANKELAYTLKNCRNSDLKSNYS